MRSVSSLLAVLVPLLLAGCVLLPEPVDETANWSPNKLYTEAKDALTEGSYERAIKMFEKLEARYPYGRYAQQAQIEVAYAYYKQGESASAVAACDRFIRLHPNHPNVDYAYYLKGLANFNEDLGFLGYLGSRDLAERDPKAARDAFDAFKELVARYPESRYANDAVQRMNYLVNSMAMHETRVADYYLRRGAHVAAVNRAQAALATYPGAPASEEALLILVKAYDAMGMNDLRGDTERILKKNFPDNTYLTGRAKTDTAWWKFW